MKTPLRHRLALTLTSLLFTLVPFFGAKAVTVSPPFNETTLNPGDTEFGAIKLTNEDTTNPLTLYPIIRNFTYKDGDESGTPDFYAKGEREARGTEMADWIIVDPAPITLAPGANASIKYAINVPKDTAQPGGHYAALLFATEPPTAQGGFVGVGQQIASLLLVRVTGEVKEVGGINEFGFKNKELWYNYLPVDFFLRFENTGNVHLRPTGNLFIKNWYGRQVAAIKVNESFSGVLPLSIRRFEFGWHKKGANEGDSELMKEFKNFGFGKYKATLVLTYGSTNKLVTEEREFTVWPWRLMIVGGVGTIVLLTFFLIWKRIYDKGVIRRYERRNKK